ncbi:MAG: GTP cyclohydrolase I FolE [Christensenellales bacterium]
MIDKEKIEKAVKMIIEAVGEDVYREGLAETPARVARAYEEILSGYEQNADVPLSKTFDSPSGELVLEKDITFSSTCEHHLMPFFGKIAIAYIPNGKVVGLSKLARTVEVYAKRLQLQERMTDQICEAVYKHLGAKGVMVVCEGEHTCMTSRGIKKVGTKVTSYSVRGEISNDLKNTILTLVVR